MHAHSRMRLIEPLFLFRCLESRQQSLSSFCRMPSTTRNVAALVLSCAGAACSKSATQCSTSARTELDEAITHVLCGSSFPGAGPFLKQTHGRSGFFSQLNMFVQQLVEHLYHGEGVGLAPGGSPALHSAVFGTPVVGYGAGSTLGTFVRPTFTCDSVKDGCRGHRRNPRSSSTIASAVSLMRNTSRYVLVSHVIALLFQPQPEMDDRSYPSSATYDVAIHARRGDKTDALVPDRERIGLPDEDALVQQAMLLLYCVRGKPGGVMT